MSKFSISDQAKLFNTFIKIFNSLERKSIVILCALISLMIQKILNKFIIMKIAILGDYTTKLLQEVFRKLILN